MFLKTILVLISSLTLCFAQYQPISLCRLGTYNFLGKCVPCPTGFSTNSQPWTSTPKCTYCTSGTYANNTGQEKCTPCPYGSFCADPSQSPKLCPKGTYTNQYTSLSYCTICPSGLYATNNGSAYCLQCPPGYKCPDPTMPPVICPIGKEIHLIHLLL